MFQFEVLGEPIPQGSTKAFVPKGWSRPIITHDNARTKPWRQAIVEAAIAQQGPDHVPLDCAVELYVTFFLPRPASAPRRVTEPAKLPDLD